MSLYDMYQHLMDYWVEVETLTEKVEGHLKEMGLSWEMGA